MRMEKKSGFETHIFQAADSIVQVNIGSRTVIESCLDTYCSRTPSQHPHRLMFLLPDLPLSQQLPLLSHLCCKYPSLNLSVLPTPHPSSNIPLFLSHLSASNTTLQLHLEAQLQSELYPQYQKQVLEEYLMEELGWTRRKVVRLIQEQGVGDLRELDRRGRELMTQGEVEKVGRLLAVADRMREKKRSKDQTDPHL